MRGGEGVKEDLGILIFAYADLTAVLYRHKFKPSVSTPALFLPSFMPGAQPVEADRDILDGKAALGVREGNGIVRRYIDPGAFPEMAVAVDPIEAGDHQRTPGRRCIRADVGLKDGIVSPVGVKVVPGIVPAYQDQACAERRPLNARHHLAA